MACLSCLLVGLSPVLVLLLCAKHLFVTAIVSAPASALQLASRRDEAIADPAPGLYGLRRAA